MGKRKENFYDFIYLAMKEISHTQQEQFTFQCRLLMAGLSNGTCTAQFSFSFKLIKAFVALFSFVF